MVELHVVLEDRTSTMVIFDTAKRDLDLYLGFMPRSRTFNADAVRFGAKLKRLRQQRGWTKQKLATRSGMTPAYISILEEGGNVPTISTALELAEVLGADIAEIMHELAVARNRPLPPSPPDPPRPAPGDDENGDGSHLNRD